MEKIAVSNKDFCFVDIQSLDVVRKDVPKKNCFVDRWIMSSPTKTGNLVNEIKFPTGIIYYDPLFLDVL